MKASGCVDGFPRSKCPLAGTVVIAETAYLRVERTVEVELALVVAEENILVVESPEADASSDSVPSWPLLPLADSSSSFPAQAF